MTLRLTADDSNRSFSDGRVLMGGSPLRIMRLSAAGAAQVQRWLAGEPVVAGSSGSALADHLIDRGLVHPTYDESPFGVADVTVVIPVKDDAAGLAATLASIGDVARIIVIDDGSADPVETDDPLVEIFRNVTAEGPGAARNRGLAEVDSALVAFVDADVVPSPGWLDPLLAHFADPSVAAVAPRVASMPGPSTLERYEHRHSPLDLGVAPARIAQRSRVSYVPSACLVCRTTALPQHPTCSDPTCSDPTCSDPKCFDPALRYGEDVDLIWRLIDAGDTVRYEPASMVQHRPRPTLQAFINQRRGYGSAAAPLARRHPGALPPLVASWWSVLAVTLLGLGFVKLAAAVTAVGTASLKPKLKSLPDPAIRAVEISAMGNTAVGRQYASSLTRTWWPIAIVASLVSKRARRATLAAIVAPRLSEMWRQRSATPVLEIPLRLVDDLSYGAGVWQGCIKEQTIEPLVPDLTSWRP